MITQSSRASFWLRAVFWSALLGPLPAFAHCDTLDGPVVKLAATALDTGKVELVLPWVPKASEPEIREAFAHALAVRKLGPEAKQLADTHFFETVVRASSRSQWPTMRSRVSAFPPAGEPLANRPSRNEARSGQENDGS
jgi:hypothetical protein